MLSHFICRFRWVYCQILYLRGCLPGRIRHALDELPDTLDETYERTLRDINKVNWELAYRLLQCVAVASRPLRVAELAEILSFDFKTGPIPKFCEELRLVDPVDDVLSTTSNLLAIVNVSGSPIIQFSHFSVKEYLTSARLAEANDFICRRYHISMTPAHTLAARACLGILLHLDKMVANQDSLEKIREEYPLAEYAAKHWVDHAKFDGVSEFVEDGMKRLFDPRNPHLAIWVSIYDPEWPLSSLISRAKMPLQPKGSALHYAALYGLPAIVEFLVNQHSQDVRPRGFDQALHPASKQGHEGVTRLPLEYRVDLTPKDNVGLTPLHLTSNEEIARTLLENGADTAARAKDGRTPLLSASHWGHTEVVRVLLDHGVNLAVRAYDGKTALHLASKKEVARVLLESGADKTIKCKKGWTPLLAVSSRGHAETADLLLEYGADLAARASDGSTALHLASNQAVALVLLKHGANITAQNNKGWTPLHSVSHWGHAEIAHMFLKRGASLAARTYDGSTALHLASRKEVACVLLEHEADATIKNEKGWTPLLALSSRGHAETVRFLLEHGVDLEARASDGSTALHLASKKEVARVLLEHGAKTTVLNVKGWTPLHSVSHWGHAEIAHLLLEHDADLEARASDGSTALHLASKKEVARVLLKHGAQTTAQNANGWTPLHAVAHWGHAEIVRLLLEHGGGVDLAARAKDGSTALQLASNPQVVCVLREHGAHTTTTTDRIGDRETPLHFAPHRDRGTRGTCSLQAASPATLRVDAVATAGELIATGVEHWHAEVIRFMCALIPYLLLSVLDRML
jgi:ankyrin repeat protein